MLALGSDSSLMKSEQKKVRRCSLLPCEVAHSELANFAVSVTDIYPV